jgi:integrase
MGIKFNEKIARWEAHYSKRHPLTRRPVTMRRRAKSKADAQRLEKVLIIEVEDKLRQVISPLWQNVVNEYLRHCEILDHSKRSIICAESSLRANTGHWSRFRVDQITRADIVDSVKTRNSEKSLSTQKSIYKHMQQVFKYGVAQGYLKSNPMPHMKFRIGDRLKGVLTEPQVGILLEAAKNANWFWYPHYAMAVYTGMRNGELYALKWDKVNIEQRDIYVCDSWDSAGGYKDKTKSGNDRIVEIAPPLVFLLKELKLITGITGYVLPRCTAWNRGDQARELRKFLIGINLPPVRFHDLRATWATIMLTKGIAPIKVMAMGGWTELKTMQMYIRKAGIEIQGITDDLILHDPSFSKGTSLLDFGPCS